MTNPEPGYYWAYLWRQHYDEVFPNDDNDGVWGEPDIVMITHSDTYGYEMLQMGYDVPIEYKPNECKLLRKVVYELP